GLGRAGVREVLDLYEATRSERPQLTKFLQVLAARRAMLKQQQEDIAIVLAEIDSLERQCRKRLRQGNGGSNLRLRKRHIDCSTSAMESPMATSQTGPFRSATTVPADPGYAARVRASFERQGAMRLIGARLTELRPGHCTIELPYREDLTQQHGYVHAGIVSAIADSAGG